MTWLKVDDKLHQHPKFVGCSVAAYGTWLIGASYAADLRTDGYVPTGVIANRDEAGLQGAKELVAAGLWKPVKGGWQIHDFLKFNPSAADLAERSKTNARNGAKGGSAKAANAKRPASEPLAKKVAKSSPRSRTPEARASLGASSFPVLGLVPAPGGGEGGPEPEPLDQESVRQVEGEVPGV